MKTPEVNVKIFEGQKAEKFHAWLDKARKGKNVQLSSRGVADQSYALSIAGSIATFDRTLGEKERVEVATLKGSLAHNIITNIR